MFMVFIDFPKDFQFLPVFFRVIIKFPQNKNVIYKWQTYSLLAYKSSSDHSESHFLPYSH